MAVVPVAIFFGDSNMSGLAELKNVPSADFTRWCGVAWPTTTFAVDQTEADDVSVPDVQILTPSLPYEEADERNITATPAANQVTLDGANLTADQQDSWVYVSMNTTGYGQVLRINADPSGGTTVTLLDPLTLGAPFLAIANNGKVKLLSKSHTIASVAHDSDDDTSTITKTATTPDFSAAADDWVSIIGTSLATYASLGTTRRVVSASGNTIVVSPRLTGTDIPAAGDGIRELTAADTARKMSELVAANMEWRDLRFYHDGNTSYTGPGDYPTMLSLMRGSPREHMTDDRVNGLTECTFGLKNHFTGDLYVVVEAQGGATAVTQPVGDLLAAGGFYSYKVDIDYNDFRPDSPNGLWTPLIRYLDAAKAKIVAAGNTMDVIGIFSNVGTNDAGWEDRANLYYESMAYIIDTLRNYIVDNSMSTRAADRIPFGLTTVNAPLSERAYKATVNTAMEQLAQDKPSVYVVDATDFGLRVDNLHLTAAGQIAWGKAFYAGWAALYDDHTAIVVEDGTGMETANSYVSLSDADEFIRAKAGNPSAWTGATVATKQDALRQATLAIDLRYGNRWSGNRVTSEQALDWPREYAVDGAGNYIDSDVVPTRLAQATALLALLYVQGETIMATTEDSADIASETKTVGPISKSVTYRGAKPSQTRFPMVDKMLYTAGLVTYGGVGWGSTSW